MTKRNLLWLLPQLNENEVDLLKHVLTCSDKAFGNRNAPYPGRELSLIEIGFADQELTIKLLNTYWHLSVEPLQSEISLKRKLWPNVKVTKYRRFANEKGSGAGSPA